MADDSTDLYDEIVSSVVNVGFQHLGMVMRPEFTEQMAREQMFNEHLAVGRLLAV